MDRSRATVGFLLVLVSLGVSVAAQEPSDPTGELQQRLFRQTIIQDISTAGFYELISWAELLGLSTRGDRATIAARIYDFYEVPAPQRPADEEATEPPIVIDSAARTSYFTLEETNERYIRLAGGVVLTLRDEEQNAVHRILADEVTFNQDQNTVAASGNVVYILERDGTTEQFTGEALTVQLDSWEGAFVRGVTERERTIDGEAIDFSFAGSYITRSSDDVIVMEDGRITSSQADPPNYEIRARKIWVFAPGEWGLQNALLYVGRVPVFYFPFFFRPGNRFFFNPAVGARDRSGSFIQTTSYLVGEPERPSSAFSFLQLADEQSGDVATRREGLYLVPDPEAAAALPQPASDSVRLLADLYTKLGAFASIEGEFGELGPLEQVEFAVGLAASRNIYVTSYPGAGVAYTPYYLGGGTATQHWNVSRVGSLTLPFRFGLDFSGAYSGERLRSSVGFTAFSDPRFNTDFRERSEQIDWLGILGQGAATRPGLVSTQLWQVRGSYSADVSEIERISSLSLQNALIALTWRSRTIEDSLLDPAISAADDSPEGSFYYPQSLRAPELTAAISGTLWQYPQPREDPVDDSSSRTELVPPWDEAEDQEGEDMHPDFRVPPIQPALPAPALPAGSTASVSYTITPTLVVDQQFLDDAWAEPSDVDFAIAYGGASARMGTSLGYRAGLAGSLVQINGAAGANGQYREVFSRNPDLPDPEWNTLQEQAWSFSSLSATNNLTTRLFPLRYVDRLAGSTVSYTLNTLLYRLSLEDVVNDNPVWESTVISWDEEFVRQHELRLTGQLEMGGVHTIGLSAVLPPRDAVLGISAGSNVGWATANVATGFREQGEEWVVDPVAASVSVEPLDWLTASGSLSYNVEDDHMTFTRARLSAGGASAEFEARRSENFEFGGSGVGWQPAGAERLRPFRAAFGASLDRDIGPTWRNRIVGNLESRLNWETSLVRFTEGSLRFTLSGALLVHRFLALAVSTSSSNTQSYVYVPALAEMVGREPRNLLVDLIRSFNFFNRSAREESGFNLDRIQLGLLHDLGDWDLTVSYSGAPELTTAEDSTRSYDWRGNLAINVQWRPISELTTDISIDEEEIRFGTDS